MTELGVLVDSNVLIDIVQADPTWSKWSVDALSRCRDAGINPIIYTELCYQRTSVTEVDRLLEDLSLCYSELPRPALYLAAQAFRHYRQLGGTKNSPLPDFYIGAHAAALDIPILTRDTRRYQTYFPTVTLISPEK